LNRESWVVRTAARQTDPRRHACAAGRLPRPADGLAPDQEATHEPHHVPRPARTRPGATGLGATGLGAAGLALAGLALTAAAVPAQAATLTRATAGSPSSPAPIAVNTANWSGSAGFGSRAPASAISLNTANWSGNTGFNVPAPGWYTDRSGIVHLQGAAKLISSTGAGVDTMGTLPTAARPSHNVFTVVLTGAGTYADLVIATNGQVSLIDPRPRRSGTTASSPWRASPTGGDRDSRRAGQPRYPRKRRPPRLAPPGAAGYRGRR
jgi:hypothetical protein